jgi:hypothetical protein
MKLRINDDDGFIALVNSANYQGFVDEDWQFEQLMSHFVGQMNAGNIVIWQTSNDGGGNWLVSIQEQPSSTQAFRQFEQVINVTKGELFLTNYSDLTMVAQFADSSVPGAHNSDLKIALENGWYKLTVRQLFDPGDFDIETDEDISFEIITTPIPEPVTQQIQNVYWFNF